MRCIAESKGTGMLDKPDISGGNSAGDSLPMDAAAVRASLVEAGHCQREKPAVILELYGGLRIKSGCSVLPLHAGNIAEAIDVLRRVFPKADDLLPEGESLGDHYRFSINGKTVTRDISHPLVEGDRLVLFSASVGG